MKKLILVVLTVGLVFALGGCAGVQRSADGYVVANTDRHIHYLDKQVELYKARKPILDIQVAQGQTLMITGMKSLQVWGDGGAAATLQPYESPGYKLAHAALGFAPMLFGWGMLREVVRAAPGIMTPHERSVVDPYERSVVDPFTREAIDPFVLPTETPFVAPVAP